MKFVHNDIEYNFSIANIYLIVNDHYFTLSRCKDINYLFDCVFCNFPHEVSIAILKFIKLKAFI